MKTTIKTIFLLAFLALQCLGAFCVGAYWYVAHNNSIDFSALEYYTTGKPCIVYDVHGVEWTRFQLDKRDPISLSVVPKNLIQAFVATEDWAFFSHSGLSVKGIVRSVVYNLYYGRKVQGASTITQQLVRLLFFDAYKTFSRKLKEQFYALLVEQQFTKEQILEAYLNHVYFGCGIYGVEAASQRFWGKSTTDLTLQEAATLAGIVRSPGNYCPLLYPRSAQKRRNVVLHSMHKLNYISTQDYEQAKEQELVVVEKAADGCAPHLRETLRQWLEEVIGKEQVYGAGLTVQTTLDLTIQRQAATSFAEQCALLRATLQPDVDGGLITLDGATGEIRALVGGVDFKKSKFNRAFQARRQMGSVLKPLLYAQVLLAGKSFTDTEIDESTDFMLPHGQHWKPRNFNHRFNGQMTLARALISSNNIVTIKTLLAIGVDTLVDAAKRCHIQGISAPYPSLALGCVDATLKEVAGMFNVFAQHGWYAEPHYVRWVKDGLGKKIWRAHPVKEQVLDAVTTGKVAKVLMTSLERVKRFWRGPWMTAQAFGKTGTTNDSRTCWFAGSTPSLTTVVYIGCDDNRSLGDNVYPSRTAFPIWAGLHTGLQESLQKFVFDSCLREAIINGRTGAWCCDATSSDAIKIFI